jgi:2-polyprenyl-6-hydroxyphenyl methylase / 3-demethylubiquinone-9 3-methyltransferase
MNKIPDDIYQRINNNIYNTEGNRWWSTDFSLNLIRTFLNPFRVRYAKNVIDNIIKQEPEKISVLEVGCGGGILSEEFAGMGYITTGIDPAENSLNAAIHHSKESNLNINYVNASGENLPFQSGSFDVVLCCDVLEHVQDLPAVVSEISRVLKTGGVFIYDTFNRTWMSKISTIKILQEWKRWAIMPPDLHVWEMFITPREMKLLLKGNGLTWKEHQGLRPGISYLKMLNFLRQRAIGKLTYEEFGEKFHMVESSGTQIMYMGYAVKA